MTITFNIKLSNVKRLFFDKAAVQAAFTKQERQRLSKFGAFVRTRAKSSIRKRAKPSAPGSPPSSHTGLLKKHIYFAADPVNRSVVIGPTPLEDRTAVAPEALEVGGMSEVSESGPRGSGVRRRRRVFIRPRPFMEPAFREELAHFREVWA